MVSRKKEFHLSLADMAVVCSAKIPLLQMC